ncbi:MAG: redoxin domain-containing protein [Candidatus Sericytochromatia bacterium]|nr:redoxin domain-containing protein [Candidatus Tanganyikabacteria bacterium]
MAVLVFGAPAALAAPEAGPRAGDPAPAFELEDQHSVRHESRKLKGKVVFLLFGPQALREDIWGWAGGLAGCYGKRQDASVFVVSGAAGLPPMVPRGFFKDSVKHKRYPVSLLFDWERRTAKAYGVGAESSELFVVGPDGAIVLRVPITGYAGGDLAALEKFLQPRLGACGQGGR